MNKILTSQEQASSNRIFDAARNRIGLNAPNGATWSDAEVVFPSAPQPGSGLIQIATPLDLVNRRLYYYVEVLLSVGTANYNFDAEIEFRLSGQTVGRIPVAIARDETTFLGKSRVCLISSAGYSDAVINVVLSNRFAAGPSSVRLHPLKVPITCDQILFSVTGWNTAAGCTFDGYRIWLGVLSHQ